ncbi:MAG: DNA repair protein RadA [Bacillota bacterium]
MGTRKPVFRCSECGYEAHKWLGRCSACDSWNTMQETAARPNRAPIVPAAVQASSLKEIPAAAEDRIVSGIGEFDRVLGGGAVTGSVVLLGGDPGIGKSTLLLQAASRLSQSTKVLYASGEESLRQIKMRAQRLQVEGEFPVLASTEFEQLLAVLEELSPQVMVLDSVQSFYKRDLEGVPGSINQVREVTADLVREAKGKGMVVFLVGHVTKEGIMAGPRLLEHMVDCVLYLEGDRYHSFRILRSVKNRFGSTNEIGVFMMEEKGLEEISNPSHLFITQRVSESGGAVVTASVEGTRPLLVEIQSLVTASNYPSPRRTSAGIDLNRVALIMAVLEKHAGISFLGLDTFVNVVGGVRLVETAVDLALALSLVTSLKGKGLSGDTFVLGEVGLTGEIRPVNRINQRINEGIKLGFKRIILPRLNLQDLSGGKERAKELQLVGVDNIKEAVGIALL